MVDYVVGAIPTPGVYCIAERTQPLHRHLLELYKLGEGPLYSFYHPYHLCHFEMHNTVARIVLFGDSCGSSLPEPSVEVVAIAKRDLHAGEVLDDYGEYMTYGEAENVPVVRAEGLVPEGLVAGCRLLADVAKDHPVRWSQVVAPTDSLGHRLYREMVGTSA
jgi:predicted homoserine dehydrogenase-like protein